MASQIDVEKNRQRFQTKRLKPGLYQTFDRKYKIYRVRDDLWGCKIADTGMIMGKPVYRRGRYFFGHYFESKKDWVRELIYNENQYMSRDEFSQKYRKK